MSIVVFWCSLTIVAYTYAGYAALVTVLARRRGVAPLQSDATPALTVVVAAYNEVGRIGARVSNLLGQDYPAEQLRVIVVSDGSTDGTEHAVASDDRRVRVLALRENCGKATALNAALAVVETELVVFTDARQAFAPDALRRLVAAFADPSVGAVTGELEIASATGAESPAGLYWRMEKHLRSCEARIGWLHGVSGAVYALRTGLFRALPADTLLDDMWIPLHAVFARYRIWMARDAIAYDIASGSATEEYRRKLRTLAGNWQLLERLPRLLNPWRNPVFVAWLSHKFLRLLAPWLLIAAFISSMLINDPFYQFAFQAQCAAYGLAIVALLAPRMAAHVPLLPAAASFVMLNAAALLSLPASVARDARVLWRKH